MKRIILAVPAAALMLGAAEAGSTVGINFSGDTYGYFAGVPVTATAFGVSAADWQSTPISWGGVGYDYASTSGSMTVADLGVSWNATNTWLTVDWNPPTPVPGDAEVTYGMLDNTGWSCGLTNLNAKFPSGYVVELVGAGKTTATSSVSITENSGSTLVGTVAFTLLANGHGLGASPVLANDAITLTNISRNDPTNCALGGFIVTDKPVVSRKPIGTTVATGDTISLTARAVGIPPMTYQWFNGATPVTAIATEPTADTITTTYTKSGAVAGDSGSYTLVVTNAHGTGTSVAAAVTVTVPATVTWDADGGTTGSQDGSGTWNATNTNWWDGAGDVAWSNLNFANFGSGGSGAATVTLDDDALASGLTFSDVDYTLATTAAKTLSLAGSPQITTNSNATLAVPLAGTGALTKTGPGTLSITSRGTFSGPITVQQGTLAFPVTGDIPGYWYQWLLNTSVINLMPGTTLNCPNNAFGWYGNNNATGLTININGATCQPNGAFGIAYNLTGGTIGTGASRLDMGRSGGFDSFIHSKASSTTSVVNPGGGEVLFRVDSGQTVFTFDTEAGTTPSGIDLDIQQPLHQNGTSSVVKTGPGTMKLSAINTYSGGTTINGGKLVVAGQVSGSSTTVNAGTLEVTGKVTNTGEIWFLDDTSLKVTANGATPVLSTTGTMSVGTDYNLPAGMNNFTFESLSSNSVAPVSAGTLFLDSPLTVNIASVTPIVGQYPLMKFTGTPSAPYSLTLGTLPGGVTATLVDDTFGVSKSIYLDVTAVAVPNALWTGITSSTWDINTTSNWTVGGSPANYLEGNVVTFDDTAGNTSVTLNTTVNPSVVTFANETKNYMLSGSGAIAGSTALTKTGAGTLTVSTANTYSGVTTITGGKLVLLDTTATLMSGGIVDNSVLEISAVAGPLTYNSSITGTGTLTKSGSDTLTITGGLALTTPITVAAGTLEMQAKSGDAPYVINSGGTLKFGYSTGGGYANTNLKIHGDGAAATTGFHLKGGSTYNVSGTLELLDAPTTIRQYGTGLASIGIFDINSTGLSCSAAASGSETDSNVKFVSLGYGMSVQIETGANTATGDFILNGPLDVDHSGNGFYKRGAGSLRLNAAATANNRNVRILGGTIICGIADCLGTNAALQINSGGVLALNGFNQTVKSLYFGNAQQASGTWGAPGSGATHIDGTRFSGTGVLSVTTAPDFSAWAVANAPGQTVSQDHDNDGVSNGIEYFMGLSGSAFTANPGVVAGKVSWPKGAAYIGAYGVDYVVQTSPDLTTWTDILVGDPNLSNGTPLEYTLPTASKVFTRLKVTGP